LNDGSWDDARSVAPRSQHAVPSQCYDDRFNAATEQGFCSGFDIGNRVRWQSGQIRKFMAIRHQKPDAVQHRIRHRPRRRRIKQDRHTACLRNGDNVLDRHNRRLELADDDRSLGYSVRCRIDISRQQKIVGSGGDGDTVFTGGFA